MSDSAVASIFANVATRAKEDRPIANHDPGEPRMVRQLCYEELVAVVPLSAASDSPLVRGILQDIWPDGSPGGVPELDHTTRFHYHLAGVLADRFTRR